MIKLLILLSLLTLPTTAAAEDVCGTCWTEFKSCAKDTDKSTDVCSEEVMACFRKEPGCLEKVKACFASPQCRDILIQDLTT